MIDYQNTGPHEHAIFKGLSIWTCRRCDSSWTPSPPTGEQLSDYYATNYTPARMGHVTRDRWPIWDSRPASLITLGRMFTDFRPGDLFVDVGPGNGASLSLAPLMLPEPAIGCVEFNKQSIDFFRRHIERVTVAESLNEFAVESAKMVYSAHSLEHFRPDDLLAELESIRRVLAPGGAFTIEVPCAPSERIAKAWRHSPHLLFFTPDGLSRLLTRAGFMVRLCAKTEGRSSRRVEELLPPAEGVNRAVTSRLSGLNVGDLVHAPGSGKDAGVIKCVATKEF